METATPDQAEQHQYKPETDIDEAVYLASLNEVRKIVEDRVKSENAQEPIIYYAVVNGGDSSYRHLPVTSYAEFKTAEEAISFKSNVLAKFPNCRVAKQGWVAEVEAGYIQTLENLFTFGISLTTDEFKPRAKRGETLIMKRYIEANDGDIVAIGNGDNLLNQVAWYVDGMEYCAVCVAVSTVYR